MSKFAFRLQPLVKLREADRDRCREELAAAYRADQILSDRQAATRQEVKKTRDLSQRKSQPGTIEVEGLINAHRYELILGAQLEELSRQREKVSEEIERRRQALVEADKELRILEKLRERLASEHRLNEERLHARQMDEVALRQRHVTHGGYRP